MWPWELKAPHMCLVALVAPWGQGVERNLQRLPWVMGTLPPVLKVTCPGPADHRMLLCGTFVISQWPIMSSPLLLQVDAGLTGEAGKGLYSCPGRPPLPATVLWADQKLACILPEGHDLPLLVPITALSFCP